MKRAVANCGAAQRLAESTKIPLLPPSIVISNLVTGASGSPSKVARMPPRFLSIRPSTKMRMPWACKTATMSGRPLLLPIAAR